MEISQILSGIILVEVILTWCIWGSFIYPQECIIIPKQQLFDNPADIEDERLKNSLFLILLFVFASIFLFHPIDATIIFIFVIIITVYLMALLGENSKEVTRTWGNRIKLKPVWQMQKDFNGPRVQWPNR